MEDEEMISLILIHLSQKLTLLFGCSSNQELKDLGRFLFKIYFGPGVCQFLSSNAFYAFYSGSRNETAKPGQLVSLSERIECLCAEHVQHLP